MRSVPPSLILFFACAEFEELRKSVPEGRKVYDQLLDNCRARVEALQAAAAEPPTAEQEQELVRAAHDLSLVCIMFMRFARRNTVRHFSAPRRVGRGSDRTYTHAYAGRGRGCELSRDARRASHL